MFARVIVLTAGSDAATIVPEVGGRVGSLTASGIELLVTAGPEHTWMSWGSYPMAPWAGRLRAGRFTHDGVTHQLAINLPPHAIHGTVAAGPWDVEASDERTVTLSCDLGDSWPLGGTAHQRIALDPGQLTCTLGVTAGGHSMPVAIGWHPWFRSAGPVEIDAIAMYERGADGLPTGRLVAPTPPPWDDCFQTTAPARCTVGDHVVTISSDCDHLVVFDELAAGVAIEPQSGPPDALNLANWFTRSDHRAGSFARAGTRSAHRAESFARSGTRSDHTYPHVLGPGATLERTMTISWRPTEATRG